MEKVRSDLNLNIKKQAFATSSINHNPNCWVPKGIELTDDGYYFLGDNLSLEREWKGVGRTKYWVIEDGKKALFAENSDKNEEICSLIYCAIADLAGIPCMSSVPAKKLEKNESGDEHEVRGLLSLNVCKNGERLIGADLISPSAKSIKEVEKASKLFATQKRNCFLDDDFTTDFCALAMLDYFVLAGDKNSPKNYNLAEIKLEDKLMLYVAPAVDNGLAFGLKSKSFLWYYKSERFKNRLAQISDPSMKKEIKEAFNSEFGEVLPIMPYKDIQGNEIGDREDSFLEQMSVLILENDKLKEIYNNLMNIKFEDVKGVMQTRHKGLNVADILYHTCETIFDYRRQALSEKVDQMASLKAENPEEFFQYVDEIKNVCCDEDCMLS